MTTGPRVSVITIFLDAERFLAEAVDSVLAQTYRDWELILVDDGSMDESTEIARSYASRYPHRIRYVEHPGHENRGMSASRNLGIRAARGDLIALLDSDDVYLPRMLERQVGLLEARPDVDFVYGNTEYWYSWGDNSAADARPDRVHPRGFRSGTVLRPGECVPFLAWDVARTPPTCSVVMRRNAVNAVGGFEEPFRGLFEDQVFFFKLFQTATCYVDDECVARHRQHSASFCAVAQAEARSSENNGFEESRRLYLEWLEKFLREHEHPPVVWRRIRIELLPHRYSKYMLIWKTLRPVRKLSRRFNRVIRRIRSDP